MTSYRPLARTWLIGLSLCAAGKPQEPAPDLAVDRTARIGAPRSIIEASVGLQRRGDGILGEGADYQARFDADGFTFVPARASGAPELRLHFRLHTVARRDAGGGDPTEPAAPIQDPHDHVVRYPRGRCVESYEIEPDGVKQSFTFAKLPPGRGDLIVRGSILTDLPLTRAAEDEVRFEIPGSGGVRIGGVVGIDATGARAAGVLRFHAGILEMSLPAAFVDGAALPLVLDPLVSSTVTLSSGFFDYRPDVAYDPASDTYLVVWDRSTLGVRGQRVDGSGVPVGGTIFIHDYVFAEHPRVANVSGEGHFLVVWNEVCLSRSCGDILGRVVSASTGALVGSTLAIASGTDFQRDPDVGGEATSADDEAIVVWHNWSQHRIEAAQVNVGNAPFVLGTSVLSGGFYDANPRISHTGGSTGHHLIVWDRRFVSVASPGVIRGAVVDRNLNVLDSFVDITSTTDNTTNPAVDGDGTCWVVAYHTEASAGSGDLDVACRGVCYDPSSGSAYLSPAGLIVEGSLANREYLPGVTWMGNSALVAYIRRGRDNDARIESVDPFSCLQCEGEFALPDNSLHVTIARRTGRGRGEDALIAWQGLGSVVDTARFRADHGRVTDLGGGCGDGGTARATCAITGNATFTVRVRQAASRAPASVVLAARRIDAPCGACVLVPDPFAGFVLTAGSTDSHGNAAVTLAIPASAAVIGATLYQQWVLGMGASCGTHDFSNALRVEIQ